MGSRFVAIFSGPIMRTLYKGETMFKYKYYLTVVDPEKNIVTLTPHWSTWAKALAPTLIFTGGMLVVGAVLNLMAEDDTESVSPEPDHHL
jgi:hypothetical protein